MLSQHIEQTQKAQLFIAERKRIRWLGGAHFEIQGYTQTHCVHRNGRGWECSCMAFQETRGIYDTCCHIIALVRVLNDKPELAHV